MRCGRHRTSPIIRRAEAWRPWRLPSVNATGRPRTRVNWECPIETNWRATKLQRSSTVTLKFGIKSLSMFAGLGLATVIVAGCTEEAPPRRRKPPRP